MLEQPQQEGYERRAKILDTKSITKILHYYRDYGFSPEGYLVIPETIPPAAKYILFLYLHQIGIHILYIGNFSSEGFNIKRIYTIPRN